MARRSLIWVTICTCVVFCAAIPTRRQFVSIAETTSSEPGAVVTNEGAVWDENDDFDLDGDEEWMGEAPASPSSVPQRAEYEEYDDDEGDEEGRGNRDEDIDHQDAEEEEENDAEFLFVPSRDTRLVLQDDDDPSGPIKVRHTGKNSYPEIIDSDNSVEDSSKEGKNEDSQNFEFTIDNDDEEESNSEGEDKDDFVLEDTRPKNQRREASQDEDDNDDDDNFVASEDDDDDEDPMFENPEEDSQVIYGDHLFLY